ncbi:heterokaryon incompatibility protein-domain-containing protein [Fusarium solani]|uniref:Heterokaryon incompatibility protein-domain-containing protein n=1 Tax=Fusarium solani TaxID=169388 RepID=A0A9P9K7A9_FUSSL|nr:heterokaryon incompatibility protein-domain-containing protein [Fusarium solani]KAH7246971.1 heterokaryon incompatibility protein-domain-containing protein [Fusarium solani]
MHQFMMGDAQEMCGCGKPDVTVFETCLRCGNAVSFEELRQRAVNTYDKDNQPIEDPGLPRRHSLMKDPKRCLRLLHLNDSTSHVLSGRFESDWIQHVRPYEAVSYTWGGEDGDYTKMEFIIIDGTLFPITKNCAAVLHKIRKPGDSRAIWIDSLCINQNDVNERSVQVSQMGKIFSGAQKVHIYIGNNVEDRTASNAFDVLSSIRNLSDFSKGLRIRKDRVQAVKTMFAQTYFSRMWIIQEVLLAKTAELHWGTATILWQPFNEDHLRVLGYGIDSYIPEWMRIRATTKNFRNSETLADLLFSAMGSTASNNRDKVYGIYGLLLDAEEEGLTVDYSLSVAQVFTNMAAHLIKKHNALRAVLRHVNPDAPLVDGEQLSSWVPDFRSKFVSQAQEVSISRKGFKDLEIHTSITPQEWISSCGTNELFLRGHRLTMPELVEGSSIEYWQIAEFRGDKWEIRAKFQVDFDPQEDTIFWIPNGVFLQLRRHPNREEAYTVLGECDVKQSGAFPAIGKSFADALEPHYLRPLWQLCMDLEYVSHRNRVQYKLESLILPDTSMGWEHAKNVLNAYDSLDTSDRRHILDPDARTMFDFLSFCQSEDTWATLRRSRFGFNHRDWPDAQNINELCQSWLQCYEKAENILGQFLKTTYENVALRLKFLKHLETWEKTTETLLKELKWSERRSWPFKPAPRLYRWDCDEVGKDSPGKKIMRWAERSIWPLKELVRFDIMDCFEKKAEDGSYDGERRLHSVIRNNFNGVRFRFDLPMTAARSRDERIHYILEPWGEEWTGTIRSMPHLLSISKQLSSEDLIRLEKIFLRNGALKSLAGIGPAETITLL